MTSPKKVAANQNNGRKSRGPRTGTGKARSSRNARRHGLAAFCSNDPVMSGQIKQMVDAICHGDDDPLLREQAVVIAESQLWLSCIGWEKLAAFARLRDPEESALTGRYSRQARAKIKAKIDVRFHAFDVAYDQLVEVNALIDATKRAGRDYEREPLPAHLEAAWPPAFLKARKKDRDEYQVLREGIRDLERLLRYEGRAWSRRKRAVRAFMAIKLTSHDRMGADLIQSHKAAHQNGK
jgi:hypothetical protein